MRWGWLWAAALAYAPLGSAAQEPEVRGYGAYRFGMTVDEARAVEPTLTQESMGADLTLLAGTSPMNLGGVSFRPRLAFRAAHLTNITLSAAGLVTDANQCVQVLSRVVSALEPIVGAFWGPQGPSEYGAPRSELTTPGGSRIRVYVFDDEHQQHGNANSSRGGWVEASLHLGPHERAPAGNQLCEIDIQFREHAPELTPPEPPTPYDLSRARPIEHPTWVTRASSDTFELTLPPVRIPQRTQVSVDLDCLVLVDGSLNCAVERESPTGRWFGEAARRISRAYRIAAHLNGEPTAGRRVHVDVDVTLQGPASTEPISAPAPQQADTEELRALAARAPSRATLDAAPLIEHVQWVERPTGASFERYYPPSALERSISGRALLECLVAGDGRLECAVIEEEPVGEGFGLAALGIAQAFRIALEIDGQATIGKRVRVPIRFMVE